MPVSCDFVFCILQLGMLTFSFFWKRSIFSFSYRFLFLFPIVLKTIVFLIVFKTIVFKWSENETKNDGKTKTCIPCITCIRCIPCIPCIPVSPVSPIFPVSPVSSAFSVSSVSLYPYLVTVRFKRFIYPVFRSLHLYLQGLILL